MRAGLLVPLTALMAGFFAVYLQPYEIPFALASYVGLAALAGVDSICGGIRAGLEGKFHDDIFLTGFAMNTVLCAALAYLGDRIGVDLFLAAVVVLGGRVLLNLSLIRRYALTRVALSRTKTA